MRKGRNWTFLIGSNGSFSLAFVPLPYFLIFSWKRHSNLVNFASILTSAAAATFLVGTVAAHPGEKHDHVKIKREIDARGMRTAAAKRSLAECQDTFKHHSLMRSAEERRANTLDALRHKRGITAKSQKYRRDLALLQQFENVNHNTTGLMDYPPNILASEISAANTSCIFSPEVTDGLYYVTGEMIRKNVVKNQKGFDLYFEVNTLTYYSGVESSQGGLNTTFLRGVQETDADGVVAFETLFPGHYEDLATHTHLIVKTNVTVRSNGTTGSNGAVTHIGQLFWPEDLKSAVEAKEPYASNTQDHTTNDEDMWSIVQTDNEFDPFPENLYLGEDVEDG
ncbi:hypothetical protein G6011_10340 [Alternaria panax]|uniref:Intradiol ring-cleavage dioxygenases domain-containing protein n=1 Tax=Alternaria panax TaxID=48097 RepID=A0AAD4IBE3_9PLEO|nr:hypothetical protein G6011_10340 [Alternaria panax]